MIDRAKRFVVSNREKLEFGLYFVLTIITAGFVADMLARGWQIGHISKVFLLHFPDIYANIEFPAVTAVFVGLYFGFLVLLNIDPKKRWQGRILLIGSIIAILVLQSRGELIFDPVNNGIWIILGILLGVGIGGGRRLSSLHTPQPLEFRRAATAIFLILLALTVGGFLEFHVTYPFLFRVNENNIVLASIPVRDWGFRQIYFYRDIISSTVFIGTLYQFIQYDAERSFFILGPSQSGKTLFVLGAYLEALEQSYNGGRADETPMNPTNDLIRMLDLLDRKNDPWIVSPTEAGEYNNLAFRYVHGRVFPLNITISGLDYSGEYLAEIPDYLSGIADFEDHPNPAVISELIGNIRSSDTLLFVIDSQRFVNENESLEIADYFDIIQATSGKRVLLIATKSDIFAEKFHQELGLAPIRYFDDFVDYVNEQLMQNEQIQALVRETAGTEIHPVYYQTTENEEGLKEPMRDDSGSVMVVGFDRLLKRLGE